jgi:hypothetical protein
MAEQAASDRPCLHRRVRIGSVIQQDSEPATVLADCRLPRSFEITGRQLLACNVQGSAQNARMKRRVVGQASIRVERLDEHGDNSAALGDVRNP